LTNAVISAKEELPKLSHVVVDWSNVNYKNQETLIEALPNLIIAPFPLRRPIQ